MQCYLDGLCSQMVQMVIEVAQVRDVFFESFLNLLGPVITVCGMLRFRVIARKWNNFAGLSRCSPQRAHRVKVTAHHEFVKFSFFGSLFLWHWENSIRFWGSTRTKTQKPNNSNSNSNNSNHNNHNNNNNNIYFPLFLWPFQPISCCTWSSGHPYSIYWRCHTGCRGGCGNGDGTVSRLLGRHDTDWEGESSTDSSHEPITEHCAKGKNNVKACGSLKLPCSNMTGFGVARLFVTAQPLRPVKATAINLSSIFKRRCFQESKMMNQNKRCFDSHCARATSKPETMPAIAAKAWRRYSISFDVEVAYFFGIRTPQIGRSKSRTKQRRNIESLFAISVPKLEALW